MRRHSHTARRDRRGAALVEYLLALGLIALACIAGYLRFGSSVGSVTRGQADCIASLSECSSATERGSAAAPPGASGPLDAAGNPADPRETSGSDVAGGFFVDGAWGEIKGIGAMLADIPGTLVSLWDLGRMLTQGSPFLSVGTSMVPNPLYDPEQAERLGATAQAIWQSAKDYFTKEPDRAGGRVAYEAATIFIAPLKLVKAVKVAKAAKVVDGVVDLADAAGDAAKAARIATRSLRLTREMEALFVKLGRKVPTNADELARELRYLEGETGLLTKRDAEGLFEIARRERADFVALGEQVRRRDELAALTSRTAEQERELAHLKAETGTLNQRDVDRLPEISDNERASFQTLADQIALRDAIRQANKAAPKPVHIDIGGEGRYPDAINLNPNYERIPKPVVGGLGEQAPFRGSVADLVTVESAPLRPGTIDEIARIAKPGSEIRLVHPADYAAGTHQKVIDAVKGTATSITDADGITTTVIRVPP